MIRRSTLSQRLLFIFMACSIASSCSKIEPKKKAPNVIYIFADQFRQYSLGFWSQSDHAKHIQGNPDPVRTPSLDKLASEGIVFSRSVSNFPLCSPYRGMFLSGMYPDQNGLTGNCRKDRELQLRSDAECITNVFSDAGYDVSYFGKCHWQQTEPLFDTIGNFVGSTEVPGGNYVNPYDTYVPPGPDRHGIDYFYQLLNDSHFNPKCYSSDPKLVDGKSDGKIVFPKRFSSQLESEAIINYLGNTHGQRDTSKPFLMIWSLNPPHNPWTEKSTYMEFFDQYTDSGAIHYKELLSRENADSSVGHYAPYYFANVSAVDFFIGQVMAKIEHMGLDDNTIVVFTSDHGEMLGSHGLTGKNIPEIEAFSIPFVVRWRNHLKHRVEDLILSVPDVMPTILGLAGLDQLIPATVQGTNYSEILEDPQHSELQKPRTALFIQNNARGVYSGDYMFVVNEDGGSMKDVFLYNNRIDPYQLNRIPLKEMDLQIKEHLSTQLKALLEATNDKWFRDRICDDFLHYTRI